MSSYFPNLANLIDSVDDDRNGLPAPPPPLVHRTPHPPPPPPPNAWSGTDASSSSSHYLDLPVPPYQAPFVGQPLQPTPLPPSPHMQPLSHSTQMAPPHISTSASSVVSPLPAPVGLMPPMHYLPQRSVTPNPPAHPALHAPAPNHANPIPQLNQLNQLNQMNQLHHNHINQFNQLGPMNAPALPAAQSSSSIVQLSGMNVSGVYDALPTPPRQIVAVKSAVRVPNTDEWEIDYDELRLQGEIARGSFGVVYKATFRGSEVAVKKLLLEKLSDKDMAEFRTEANVMKRLHHPNVLLLMGVCSREPNLAMVTEFMPGTLWDLLHRKTTVHLDFRTQVQFIRGTARGMNYMHLNSPPVLHRDLKTPNILVDPNFVVKICDFGLARFKAAAMTGNLGTCQYMAPEVIQSHSYTERADVFSYGIIVWEVLARKPPYHGMQTMQIAYGVVHQNMRPPPLANAHPALARVIESCLQANPSLRPTFQQILDVLNKEFPE